LTKSIQMSQSLSPEMTIDSVRRWLYRVSLARLV